MIIRNLSPTLPPPSDRIPLGKRASALIEPADYAALSAYTWHLRKSHSCLYAIRHDRSGGKNAIIFMHRQLLDAPKCLDVHHINGNTLDNRRANLVLLSPAHHHLAHSVKRITRPGPPKTSQTPGEPPDDTHNKSKHHIKTP